MELQEDRLDLYVWDLNLKLNSHLYSIDWQIIQMKLVEFRKNLKLFFNYLLEYRKHFKNPRVSKVKSYI